ncbi:MAG: NifB/NifX family molybdenum-iron cluster-binding protein [Anaerolineales bacterium]
MKKFAFPTEDGESISAHLGRAPFFLVASLDDSGSVTFEKREKPHHGEGEEHGQHSHGGQGLGPTMFAPIADCQVLIARGMGEPAFERARAQSLEVILPGEKDIKAALEAYRSGTLVSDPRRIHKH